MDAKDYKILIADDSLLARKKLRICLTELGYLNVIDAKDGAEAVALYQREKPNLVFMDIVMPNQYGIDALKEIIAMDPDAMVVMVSSSNTKDCIKDSIKAGADEFISKPFTRSQLSAVLEKFNK